MAFTPSKRRVSDAENKLRLLCCLDALGAITPVQLWLFVASLDLMAYIPMQLLLHELISGGDVEPGTGALQELLFLTSQGRNSLKLFNQRVMASDRRQIRDAAAAYRAELLRKAPVHTAYEMAQAGDYRVLLSLQECELPLLTIRIATERREFAAGAIERFEKVAGHILRILYNLELSPRDWEGEASKGTGALETDLNGASMESHSRHEHTVSALLLHPLAKITLSLLLPDEYVARAYLHAFSTRAVTEKAACQLMDLLCLNSGKSNQPEGDAASKSGPGGSSQVSYR